MPQKPQIILVEDHLQFRQGLKLFITVENIADVIGEASNGIELIRLLSQHRPDLVLLDIDMPHMNGIEATKKALELMPDLKIIAFTMFEEKEYVSRMKELGLKGFILKSCSIHEIEEAIRYVTSGETYFHESLQLEVINVSEFEHSTTPHSNNSNVSGDTLIPKF